VNVSFAEVVFESQATLSQDDWASTPQGFFELEARGGLFACEVRLVEPSCPRTLRAVVERVVVGLVPYNEFAQIETHDNKYQEGR
jgi:hypothetical protein